MFKMWKDSLYWNPHINLKTIHCLKFEQTTPNVPQTQRLILHNNPRTNHVHIVVNNNNSNDNNSNNNSDVRNQ